MRGSRTNVSFWRADSRRSSGCGEKKAITANVDDRSLRAVFEGLGASVLPVNAGHAEYAARLRERTRGLGLSLAARICFAVAAERGVAVVTADGAWDEVDVGVEVRLIR